MDPPQPFPFMKLPIELRLMVYERLPIQVNRHDFDRLNNPRSISAGSYHFTIVFKTIDLAILSTSRQIYNEAAAIMNARKEHILHTPPRLIVDLASATKIYKCGGPLWHISHYLAKRAVAARKSLGTVPYVGTGMGASGTRYNPANDPDYPLLTHMMERWFRSLDHQRASVPKGVDYVPSIEMALTAPQHWPHETVLHAIRQLAYVLFAEHGSFNLKLRNVCHMYPPLTEDMRKQEESSIGKVMFGRTGNIVRAVPGHAIEITEYDEEWSANSFALL